MGSLGEPDRIGDGVNRSRQALASQRMGSDGLAQIRRDRGYCIMQSFRSFHYGWQSGGPMLWDGVRVIAWIELLLFQDTFIADLVVGLATGQIKTGAPCRSERLAKYNQVNFYEIHSFREMSI